MKKKLTLVPDRGLQADLESANAIQFDTPSLAEGQLGEIQEILFGQQLRSHTQQLASVHAHYSGLITRLTEDHKHQLKELQDQFDCALTAVDDRVSEQGSEHNSKLTDINKEMRGLLAKIGSTSQKQAAAHQQLESELHKSQKQLSEKISSTRHELLTELQSTSSNLQSNKIDRDVLAGLLARLTSELSEDSNGKTGNTGSAASTGATHVEE